jgi:hypothetical protein
VLDLAMSKKTESNRAATGGTIIWNFILEGYYHQ